MADSEAPFDVQLHLAGGPVVTFQLTADDLRNHRHPVVSRTAANDGRRGLARAAVGMLASLFDHSNDEPNPLGVTDIDGAYWMIERRTIVAARYFDPQDKTSGRAFGFLPREDG